MHVYSKGCRILGLFTHVLPLPPHHVLWVFLLPSPPCRGMQRQMILAEHGGDSWQCGSLIGGYNRFFLSWNRSHRDPVVVVTPRAVTLSVVTTYFLVVLFENCPVSEMPCYAPDFAGCSDTFSIM